MTVYYSSGTGIESQTREPLESSITYNKNENELFITSRSHLLQIENSHDDYLYIIDNFGKEVFYMNDLLITDDGLKVGLPMLNDGIYTAVFSFNRKVIRERFFVIN